MKNIDWNNVQDEIVRPEPGGYIAKIVDVEDNEQKECLFIKWDFAEGTLKGANRNTYDAHGFWPTILSRSYKPSALSFFKGFKTAVEESNRGYTFNNDPSTLVGKFIGVVLGEEEYYGKDGRLKTRLYVAETRSGQAIRAGDFTVPSLKPARNAPPQQNYNAFNPIEDDGDVPF